MIRISFEDTETGEKREELFTVLSAHSFSVAVDFMMGVLRGSEHPSTSMGNFVKEDVDMLMRHMQFDYFVKCFNRGITSHKAKEAGEVRSMLWRRYCDKIGEREVQGRGGYNEKPNFMRALKRVYLPTVWIQQLWRG